MKEKCLLFGFLILVRISALGSASQVENVIFKEDFADEFYVKSIDDLKHYLERVTGVVFSVEKNTLPNLSGVHVILNKKGSPLSIAESKRLDNGTIEDYYLIGEHSRILIIANHPLGLSRGIYAFLDKLGVRWYFPGRIWEHVPKVRDISFRKRIFGSPVFKLRDFFGTGGLFPVASISEDEVVKGEWDDWRRRNRIGGSVNISGHYWESFNLTYRNELTAHPEYLAERAGKRVPWNVSAKFCISNQGLQKLFVKDRVNALKWKLSHSKYPGDKILVSVDPSDGGGHCECTECEKMGTVSDRVFFLANLVAQNFRPISPRGFVNLFAYNEHAAPPKKRIYDNVIVQIIPYAFQKVGTPEEMITLWRAKSTNLLLYDYYGLPDWHFETPLTGRWSVNELAKKIKFWQRIGIRGLLLESSYGFGATGLGLYVMSRIGWDSSLNTTEILNSFYGDMFDEGGVYVKRFYAKINEGFRGLADVPFLYLCLRSAANELADKPVVGERVNVLRAYVHYLVLYYQYASSKGSGSDGSWGRLMQYLWELFPTKVIHTSRLTELLLQKFKGEKVEVEKWSMANPNARGIKSTKWINSSTLADYVLNDMVKYPPLEDFDYEDSQDFIFKRSNDREVGVSVDSILVLDFPEPFFMPNRDGTFEFAFANYEGSEVSKQTITLGYKDVMKGKDVLVQKVEIGKKWVKVKGKLTPGRLYQLFLNKKGWVKISIPRALFFYFQKVPTYAYLGRLWFFIPDDKKFMYYKNTAETQPRFYNTIGKEIFPQRMNKEGLFQLPVAGNSGWWSMDRAELKFLDFYFTPLKFFLHPNYLVSGVGPK